MLGSWSLQIVSRRCMKRGMLSPSGNARRNSSSSIVRSPSRNSRWASGSCPTRTTSVLAISLYISKIKPKNNKNKYKYKNKKQNKSKEFEGDTVDGSKKDLLTFGLLLSERPLELGTLATLCAAISARIHRRRGTWLLHCKMRCC